MTSYQKIILTNLVLLYKLINGDWLLLVVLAFSEGPFEDDDGISSHFDAVALGKVQGPKQIAALKVDLHTSVVKLARNVAMHKPRLIIGKGQGGLVAMAYAHPGCLEQVLATRNVQPAELPEICQPWGNVAAVVIQEPRLSKKGVQLDKIKLACPEMFQAYPIQPRRTLSWKDSKAIHYLETKALLEAAKVEVVENIGAIPSINLLQVPPLLMWEHEGRCPCGKRTFLFSQCPKCLREDTLLAEEAAEGEITVKEQEPVSLELESGASQRLPDTLASPSVRLGKTTEYVEFITDARIHSANNSLRQKEALVLTEGSHSREEW